MDKKLTLEQSLLIETQLITAIGTFHEIDDKIKREQFCREYFDEFVEKTNVDPVLTIEKMKEYFEHRRKYSQYSYKYYAKDELYRICGVEKPRKNKLKSQLDNPNLGEER